MYEAIVTAIISNSILLAVIGFLGQSVFKHYLNRDVEKYKIQLKANSDIEIESFKSNLVRENTRLQISYSGIFKRQANLLLELYKYVVLYERQIKEAMYSEEDQSESIKEFYCTWKNLYLLYEDNKILLPQIVEVHFDKFTSDFYSHFLKFRNQEKRAIRTISQKEFNEIWKKQDISLEVINNELPTVKKELTNELRRLVGIDIDEKNSNN